MAPLPGGNFYFRKEYILPNPKVESLFLSSTTSRLRGIWDNGLFINVRSTHTRAFLLCVACYRLGLENEKQGSEVRQFM